MKIDTVSKLLGISASSIQYYERQGLIDSQPHVAGKREFDSKAILALRFVRLAQAAGISIVEMKALVDHYDTEAGASGMWRSLAESKRRTVKAHIKELRGVDNILKMLLACECDTLEACVKIALTKNTSDDA
jgi:DNA-binding transcriptional MerR regulator